MDTATGIRPDDLLENIVDPVVAVDAAWRIVYLNVLPGWITPAPRDQLLGRDLWDASPDVVGTRMEQELRRAMAERTSIRFEEYHAGTQRWSDLRTFPIDGGGLCVYSHDVTERKEWQERRQRLLGDLDAERRLLKEVLRQMPAGVLIVEAPSGRLALVNDQVNQLLGHTYDAARGVEQYGEHPAYRMDGSPYEPHELPLARALAAGEVVEGEDVEFVRADGERRIVRMSAAPIHDSANRVVAAVATLYDVTERRRAEQVVLRANEELEQRVRARTAELQALNDRLQISNRELQDFASVASHDLQEPLRKIQAFGDRLRTRHAEGLGAEGQDFLARMQNAAGRMQTLINDLLAFSRVTTKAQPFRPVDLNQVAAEVLSDLESRIEQSGARVEVAALPTIDADPLQMRQLLQNLIGNALKFTQAGVSPRVRVWAEPRQTATSTAPAHFGNNGDGAPPDPSPRQPPAAVDLLVGDSGIGFDEKYLDRIFNVFQRLHGRGVYEGTGIGLAVCRKIVERHGGAITARSRPGDGATFVVTLPFRQTPAAIEETGPSTVADG
jgi:PAS domain S-box-containing protein